MEDFSKQELPHLATSGGSGHRLATPELPPKADFEGAQACLLWRSGQHPNTGVMAEPYNAPWSRLGRTR
jgi:hypothetical protein